MVELVPILNSWMKLVKYLKTLKLFIWLIFPHLLCEVAKARFEAHEWTNVHVLVADACDFTIDYDSADLITFSYSLSMIPTFNAAIDNAVSKLDMEGIIATVDFGIQSSDTSMGRINTVGGLVNRDIPWILRNFWRIWFEADKVFWILQEEIIWNINLVPSNL